MYLEGSRAESTGRSFRMKAFSKVRSSREYKRTEKFTMSPIVHIDGTSNIYRKNIHLFLHSTLICYFYWSFISLVLFRQVFLDGYIDLYMFAKYPLGAIYLVVPCLIALETMPFVIYDTVIILVAKFSPGRQGWLYSDSILTILYQLVLFGLSIGEMVVVYIYRGLIWVAIDTIAKQHAQAWGSRSSLALQKSHYFACDTWAAFIFALLCLLVVCDFGYSRPKQILIFVVFLTYISVCITAIVLACTTPGATGVGSVFWLLLWECLALMPFLYTTIFIIAYVIRTPSLFTGSFYLQNHICRTKIIKCAISLIVYGILMLVACISAYLVLAKLSAHTAFWAFGNSPLSRFSNIVSSRIAKHFNPLAE
ncbi:hypothetical protein NEHOM01_2452 [Nematocida homosporus]|uniref:uncharacterized protein n=1 Tax=Nematocida homosporus TaxID=1912981 RepID=UPI00221EBD43|nr:uncharacterized protein NEHOM01_2452 [Nematocida homosporus]KAI5187930.1 hypothetical protein NEHOM01_2452 [Nematocida homosporus]